MLFWDVMGFLYYMFRNGEGEFVVFVYLVCDIDGVVMYFDKFFRDCEV